MLPTRLRNSQGRSQSSSTWNPPPTVPTTRRIESALKTLSSRHEGYEHQLRDLDLRLTEGLTNFREMEGILQEVFTGLQRTSKQADRAVSSQVPQIEAELKESMDILDTLSETLPTVQDQVSHITSAYKSGSAKADELVSDLTWLNTDFYERWRMIIFTTGSPVSGRWKVYMRTVFIISFVVCFWLFWVALSGAYRAHRHRLVWGEKLMS